MTKSVVSPVAGPAPDRGLLPDLDQPVADRLDHPSFTDEPSARGATRRHLLLQPSGWDGELSGKPPRPTRRADATARK